jgi:hypothetical protein
MFVPLASRGIHVSGIDQRKLERPAGFERATTGLEDSDPGSGPTPAS